MNKLVLAVFGLLSAFALYRWSQYPSGPPEEFILGNWHVTDAYKQHMKVEFRTDGAVVTGDKVVESWSILHDGEDVLLRVIDETGEIEYDRRLTLESKDVAMIHYDQGAPSRSSKSPSCCDSRQEGVTLFMKRRD